MGYSTHFSDDGKYVIIGCRLCDTDTGTVPRDVYDAYVEQGVYLEVFCKDCINYQKRRDKKDQLIEKVKAKVGHDVQHINLDTRECEYICGNCESVAHATISNICRSKKCTSCR